jgi:biopolymer transport protein ExbD
VTYEELEPTLQNKLGTNEDMYIALHVDETVPMKEVVKVMNIAKKNKYKLILATRAK